MFYVRKKGASSWRGPFKEQTYSIQYSDVDLGTGRNTDGNMDRNMVNTKRSLSYQMPPMKTAELKSILNAIGQYDHTTPYVEVMFLDPKNGSASDNYMVTGDFYLGDRSVPLYSQLLDIWNNLTIDFVEM